MEIYKNEILLRQCPNIAKATVQQLGIPLDAAASIS